MPEPLGKPKAARATSGGTRRADWSQGRAISQGQSVYVRVIPTLEVSKLEKENLFCKNLGNLILLREFLFKQSILFFPSKI